MALSKDLTIHKVCATLQDKLVSAVRLWTSINPEIRRMKRLTEWINLIAAVIRLVNVISRTGWF